MAKVKRYTSPEEVRRDISDINRELDQILQDIDRFQKALAYAYHRISAARQSRITLRDSRDPSVKDKVTNIPSRALKDKEISKVFTQLKDLMEQHTVLNNIILQLESNFDQERSILRMLTDAKKTRRKIVKGLKKAKKISDQLALRHLPQQFHNRVKLIYRKLQQQLDKRYEKSSLRFIVAKVEDTFQYVSYLRFTELRDDEGFTYSEFYIVIAEVVHPNGTHSYHLTTLTDFRLPGKFTFSKYSKIDKLQNVSQLVSERLASEKFVSKVAPKKLPLSPDQIRFNHQKIAKTVVQDNKIYITLKPRTSKAAAHETRMELQGQLTNLVKARFPRNQDIIRGRVYRSGSNWRIMFVFTISRNYRGMMLDDSARKNLKEILKLSDSQLTKLQEALDQMGEV